MSEQKFSASCHVHSQPARSDVPEAERTLSGGASPHASERLDARGRSRAAASPRIRAGARARDRRSFRERPWVKAVSTAMAVLLAVTVFDTTGLAPLVQDAAAAPSAPAGALAQPAATGEDAGDAATPSDDSAADAVPAGSSDPASSGDEPSSDAAGAAPSAGDAADAADPAEQDVVDEEVVKALMPTGLTAAEEVLPQVKGGTDDVLRRLSPALVLYGAPLASNGAFLVKGQRLKGAYELGNLSALLEGGYLGGSEQGDAVVLTFDVPYLYEAADGSLRTTLSQEEWKARRGITRPGALDRGGQRAALFAEGEPEGWSFWQQHGDGYLRLSADALKEGVSGRIVARWDGNGGKLDASTPVPNLEFGLVGSVDAAARATVTYGYEAHSFTPRATEADPAPAVQRGDALRKAAGSFTLVNDETTAKASLEAELASQPKIADGGGYLASLIRVSVPKDAPTVRTVAVSAAYPADNEGRHGVPLDALMAYRLDDLGATVENRDEAGAVDTSDATRADARFVGVPGKGGAVVLDVTALTDEQRATLDPADAGALEALGVSPLPYAVAEDGRIQVLLEGSDATVEPEGQRVLYVAAPYAEAALDASADDPAAFEPVEVVVDAQVTAIAKGSTVAIAQHAVLSAAFQREPQAPAVDPDAATDNPEPPAADDPGPL